MSDLQEKYLKYIELIKSTQDEFGFIDPNACDSLLFSGLVGCVPDVKVNIDAAFDSSTGMWHRRPCSRPCFPEHSKSTISRDMLLGLAWYAYYNKRLDITEQVISYALRHNLIMGKAVDLKSKMGRCLMTPGLLSTYAWISYRLGSPSRFWLRYMPQVESDKATDFQAHLSVLHIILRNKLMKKDKYKDLLNHHFNRNPRNPLFCIAAERYDDAKKALEDESMWPKDRLPTSADRSAEWLIQRDLGKDWLPSDKGHIHSGGDFLFCYWLMTNSIK